MTIETLSTLERIWELVAKFAAAGDVVLEDAFAHAYATVREAGDLADWDAQQDQWRLDEPARHIASMTKLDPAFVRAVGAKVTLPSRPALVLQALEEFDRHLCRPNEQAQCPKSANPAASTLRVLTADNFTPENHWAINE